LGLGRPGEEMELEEMLEEMPRPRELKLEEEERGVEEVEKPVMVAETKVRAFSIGEHEVAEELREGEDVSYLRCLKCGLIVRLDEVGKLSETKCIRAAEQEAEQTREKAEISRCGYCGRSPVVGIYPTEYVEGSPIEVPLCEECARKVEEFYLKARPNVSGLTRKARVRCKHPLEDSRAVAWHHFTSTWYVRGEDGTWPCPSCHANFDRLLDVIKHFIERHQELLMVAGREYIKGLGEVSRTWQGLYCPLCGLLCKSEEDLKNHYRSHGVGEGE